MIVGHPAALVGDYANDDILSGRPGARRTGWPISFSATCC